MRRLSRPRAIGSFTASRRILNRKIKNRADWFLQVGYTTLALLLKSGMLNHAKAVSYSAVPLMMLFVYVVNTYLSGFPEVKEAFNVLISFSHLNFLNAGKASSAPEIPAWLSFIVMLWTSRGLLKSIQNAFFTIFSEAKSNALAAYSFLFIIPFGFLVIGIAMLGDYAKDHADYSFIGHPFLEATLRSVLSLAASIVLGLAVWGIVFLFYYRLPAKKPGRKAATVFSMLFVVSVIGLIEFFGIVMNFDQYSQLYGLLGEFIYVLILVYLGSLLFFFWAECLHVSERIDILVLEQIFAREADAGGVRAKIEHYLFLHSTRIFDRYGKRARAGEVIFDENEESVAIYHLYEGRVGVYREHEGEARRLGEFREGETFGVMAHLLRERRIARVMAETDCFLFVLSPESFGELVARNQIFAHGVIETLCQRISKMNQGLLTPRPLPFVEKVREIPPEAGEV